MLYFLTGSKLDMAMTRGFLSCQLLVVGAAAFFAAGCAGGPKPDGASEARYLDLSGEYAIQLRYTDRHTDHGTLMFTESDTTRGIYVGWMELDGYKWGWDVFAVTEGAQLRVNLRERLYLRQTAGLTRAFSFIVLSEDELYSRVRLATCPGRSALFRNSSRTAPGLCNPLVGHLNAKRVGDFVEQRSDDDPDAAAITLSQGAPRNPR